MLINNTKEKIFEELIQYKQKINQLNDENYDLRAKLVYKEREIKKFEKVLGEIQATGNIKSLNTKFSTEVSL